MNQHQLSKPFTWLTITAGSACFIFATYRLNGTKINLSLVLLILMTVFTSSRTSVRIPRVNANITVSDTLIFLGMLLCGSEAAILLSATEGICSGLRISKKPLIVARNSAQTTISTFLTGIILGSCFGPVENLIYSNNIASFIIAICMMALVQYTAHAGLATVATSLKTRQSIPNTWSKYFLWPSISYFVGAVAAGLIAKLTGPVGFYAVIVTIPVILIVYFTYHKYIEDLKTTAAQAERAEHERAEAERARAEQAERHVEELSRYIAEQERILEQYAQVEKLSALGELASGVAHDFNNTLAGILGRAQLLLTHSNNPEVERGLHIIIKTAQDGAKTIKRIQDFARQRRDHDFEPVPVDQLVLDISEITRPRWKDRAEAANVHINLDLQIHSHALVMGDASELREVLVNMVFNAVDAMPTGGKLTLSAEEVANHVDICISDTGTGMSPEVRSRIFDPFFSTKGKGGMGLGLAVSFGIIRRHEGSIEVESAVGCGTTFRIRLPIAKGVVKEQTPSEAMAPIRLVPQAKRTKILVVDDEDYVRELLKDILESEGHEVSLADRGIAALELFDAGNFDAVFTDIGMPGMSGWELARAIRERNDRLPLAILTGWGEAVDSEEQKAAKIDWVVTKPFTIDSIGDLAREISRRKDDHTKRPALTVVAA